MELRLAKISGNPILRFVQAATGIEIQGYRIGEQLGQGRRYRVWRATRNDTGEAVIIKGEFTTRPGAQGPVLLRREYAILRSLASDRVARAIEFIDEEDLSALVYEDIGGMALSEWILTSPKFPEKLQVALCLVEAVAYMHRERVIHMDLKPSNVVLNPRTGRVILTDFELSTRIARENAEPVPPDRIVGTVHYMSPEQTGRTRNPVDFRTDYYSLGVTFYELFTGARPFEAEEASEIIYAHLAIEPPHPSRLIADLPESLSRIILKLLAKNADDRYQSARGLLHDLRQVAHSPPDFAPGRFDRSDRLILPARLYGREEQVAALSACFERVSAGGTELVLISGGYGVGKTALVGSLGPRIARRRCLFGQGKFDQFKRDMPYSATSAALREVLHTILAQSRGQLDAFRSALEATPGRTAAVMAQFLPELELITGRSAPLPELGPNEADLRFRDAFVRFVELLASEEHPLVLFLDDVQWIDTESIRLLDVLLSGAQYPYLLCLLAFRDNEVEANHPIQTVLGRSGAAGQRMTHLKLDELCAADTMRLVADTLNETPEEASGLAEFVQTRTRGNPLFVREFLMHLHRSGYLELDAEAGAWTWNRQRILQGGITDNVARLLGDRLTSFPEITVRVLRLAASIGNEFDLLTLSTAADLNPLAVLAALERVTEEGIVEPVGSGHRDGRPGTLDEQVRFRFSHDRVQQAAYEGMSPSERVVAHRTIGNLLLHSSAAKDLPERIFDIVSHLNRGFTKVAELEEPEKIELARLNLVAGQRARRATAFSAAAEFFAVGRSLLPVARWNAHHDLLIVLYTESAEVERTLARYEKSLELIDLALAHARTTEERFRAVFVSIKLDNERAQFERALETTRAFMASELGMHTPRNVSLSRMLFELYRTRWLIWRKGRNYILDAPRMPDSKEKMAAMLMIMALPVAYMLRRPYLSVHYALRIIRLSYSRGACFATAEALSCFAMVHAGALRDFKTTAAILPLNQALALDPVTTPFRGRAVFTGNVFARHWLESARSVNQDLARAAQISREEGDLIGHAYATNMCFAGRIQSGEALAPLVELARAETARAEAEGHVQNECFFASVDAVLGYLTEGIDPDFFHSKHLRGKNAIVYYRDELGNRTFLAGYLSMASFARTVFGHYERALADLELSDYENAIMGTNVVPESDFDRAVCAARLARATPPSEKRRHERVLRRMIRRFSKLARVCPANFLHRLQFLEAEAAVLRADFDGARSRYEAAFRNAAKYGFLAHQALALESLGALHAGAGDVPLAEFRLRQAARAYRRWGAFHKVEQLEERYPFLGTIERPEVLSPSPATWMTVTRTGSRKESLDFGDVYQAAQAISAEVRLDRLLDLLLGTLLRNAGATRAALIVEEEGAPLAVVAYREGGRISDLEHAPIHQRGIPESIVNYVMRSNETVVEDGALFSMRFGPDETVSKRRILSVLCVPILARGKSRAAAYLENNALRGAFTHERIRVTQVLAAQAAISIENARLYADLERRAESAARELVRMKQIRSRMDPHFLFNSLNLIHYLIGTDPAQASRALVLLADNYRYLMDIGDADLVLFEKEWQFLLSYVELMRLRFPRSLQVIVRQPERLPIVEIPPLTLQPLVENCFKHAFRAEREPNRIELSIIAEGQTVEVLIADNGFGLSPDFELAGTRSLSRIRERLLHFFPNGHLSCSARIPEGTEIRVRFAR